MKILVLGAGGTGGYFDDNVPTKVWSDKAGNAFKDFYNSKDKWLKTWNNPDVDLEIDWVKVWQ